VKQKGLVLASLAPVLVLSGTAVAQEPMQADYSTVDQAAELQAPQDNINIVMKIFVQELADCIRISSGETGSEAI